MQHYTDSDRDVRSVRVNTRKIREHDTDTSDYSSRCSQSLDLLWEDPRVCAIYRPLTLWFEDNPAYDELLEVALNAGGIVYVTSDREC